jgi:uncharacterized surface protein with fasciclin (FAS1) repeats
MQDLIATAKKEQMFSTLLNAADILGLTGKYSEEGPFTIFAPTDAAFEPIPESVVEEAFDDREYLMNIINYHIIEGKYTTGELKNISALPTLNGTEIKIRFEDGKMLVNGIPVVRPDIECTNGIIHGIEDILLP